MPAARRPMTHHAVHVAGGRDALSGNLDAIARVTLEQGATSYARRKITLVMNGGLTAALSDDAQAERVTLTLDAPTEVRAIRTFTTVLGGATSTTATPADFTIVVNANAVAGTVALPSVASSAGRCFVIKNSSTSNHNVVIDPNNADLIDGHSTLSLRRLEAAYIQCDGTSWHVLSTA